MSIKILMNFMIPRLHHRFAALCVAAGLAISTVSCQKVPLLAPSGSSISLTTAVTVVPLGGTVEIIAQVIEPSGTPPQRGTLVSFTTSLGTLQPTEAETDTAGRAIVRFIAGNGSGTAVITALSGGVSVGGNTLRLLVGTAAVGSVRVTANPTLLPANGGTATITAQALDVNGNPLASAAEPCGCGQRCADPRWRGGWSASPGIRSTPAACGPTGPRRFPRPGPEHG